MSAARGRPGKTLGLGPPEGQTWSWMTNTMLGSLTFRALGIHARRILDFLVFEHASHSGRENGNLAATYQQMETWGVTAADVRKGLAELYATGFVQQTRQGLRQAGGGEPSRYALTWLPTHAGASMQEPPTHAWLGVLKRLAGNDVMTIAQARQWLRDETKDNRRGVREKQSVTPHLQVVSPINCEARAIQ